MQCGKVLKTSGITSNFMQHLRTAHPIREQAENIAVSPCMNKFLESSKQYSNASARKIAIDKAVMRMIALDVQPFSIVTDRGFVNLMKCVDPLYKLPSKTHLRNVILNNEYEASKEKIKKSLEQVDHVGITTDCWTSKANVGYLTVTVHFVLPSFEL